MIPARANGRSSRKVACLLIIGAFLALCNAAVQPVLSQTFNTLTSTKTDTATYFTISVSTSDLLATVLTMQYTTSTSVFTIQNVQFTTLTYFVTHIQVQDRTAEATPHSSENSKGKATELTISLLGRSGGGAEGGQILQLFPLAAAILISLLLILRKK